MPAHISQLVEKYVSNMFIFFDDTYLGVSHIVLGSRQKILGVNWGNHEGNKNIQLYIYIDSIHDFYILYVSILILASGLLRIRL